MKVAGLYLWNVGVKGSNTSLWITTGREDLALAARKANKFLRRTDLASVRGRSVCLIKGHGTIDA
jgi:hypothetical protein